MPTSTVVTEVCVYHHVPPSSRRALTYKVGRVLSPRRTEPTSPVRSDKQVPGFRTDALGTIVAVRVEGGWREYVRASSEPGANRYAHRWTLMI